MSAAAWNVPYASTRTPSPPMRPRSPRATPPSDAPSAPTKRAAAGTTKTGTRSEAARAHPLSAAPAATARGQAIRMHLRRPAAPVPGHPPTRAGGTRAPARTMPPPHRAAGRAVPMGRRPAAAALQASRSDRFLLPPPTPAFPNIIYMDSAHSAAVRQRAAGNA